MHAESEGNAISVVGIVVIAIAIVIDVPEIVRIVSRTQPPVVGATDV